MTDRQTDGQTDGHRMTAIAALIAARQKYVQIGLLIRPPVRLWRQTEGVVNILRPLYSVDNNICGLTTVVIG